MSEHTPQHHPDPVRPVDPCVDPTLIDLVAGDPPVPVTVWRTARGPADAGRSIGARLAYRLIAAYTRPGEVIVDLTSDHALAAVCTAGGRRHHPGWFTDASSLIIGPATPPARPDPTTSRDGGGDVPDMSVWFGDDLTDPDLPAEQTTTAPGHGSLQDATSLVVVCWPLDPADAANRIRLAWLLTACAQLLRPGGCLVLVVTIPAAASGPEDFTPVATAAAAVGLGYLQHIVAVAAETDGDTFVYHVTDEELLTLTQQTDQRWAVAHLKVHADLLVFTPFAPAAAPREGRRDGGDRRG
ncbi:hypothetical protein ONA91_29655 [Micromonospora sp. DR5-3]|uniref:hypothetical protein n=1 Tax=unclassified Micromonospora TaxID=2617518 RepID=UPI0011DB3BC4|nr:MULTISPECIES: hypothetical protein [unclassified Micromonospora]MCW3818612.1 hypothetical protein [Micromonospora sp. DR5-3]TYC16370.1 hypothetical protein FXF52_39390 [Micromonospora sp. MP36]